MAQDFEYWSSQAREFNNEYEILPSMDERVLVWRRAIERADDEVGDGLLAVDVGCGPGRITQLLMESHRRVVCIDPSAEMLQLARERMDSLGGSTEVSYRQDALPVDQPDLKGAAGVVACSSVLEYVEDPQAAADSLRTLLDPNGVMLVSLPSMKSWYRRLESLRRWVPVFRPTYLVRQLWRPSVEDATSVFNKAGLRVVELEYYGSRSRLMRFSKVKSRTLVMFTLVHSDLEVQDS
ncbi:MAG: class I SAM-dependent methyltransferase [Solirubrobacterales bacterium]|nr:class I SAM-dependent methyltransferase [Solirubrobacterales bacterium]